MTYAPIPGWALPETTNFAIRHTPESGRAVVAQADIPTETQLLVTSPDLSPIAHVILRPYRREVCAACFLYDRGREWKYRTPATGLAFCSVQCQTGWSAGNDQTCIDARQDVEHFSKGLAIRQSGNDHSNSDCVHTGPVATSQDDIALVWTNTEAMGAQVLAARFAAKTSKIHRSVLRHAQELVPDPDILTYVLSGVLAAYKARNDTVIHGTNETTDCIDCTALLPSLFQLVPDEMVFMANPMTSSPLHDYTSAFLVLLAVLPTSLCELITIELVINLASRAAHNAFSIRPEGMTDGDQSGEFLGWGVWPEASFFNHSCQPNVRKERRGRLWSFVTDCQDSAMIHSGQQLCITYLGGDEKDLNVHDRRTRLKEQWGFTCMCERCVKESGELPFARPEQDLSVPQMKATRMHASLSLCLEPGDNWILSHWCVLAEMRQLLQGSPPIPEHGSLPRIFEPGTSINKLL